MTRLKENGNVEAWTDAGGYALILKRRDFVVIGLDEEEEEHLLRVIEAHLADKHPPNTDGYALAIPADNNAWHFYHIACNVRVPQGVRAINVCQHELSSKTTCAKCGGSIHRAALC